MRILQIITRTSLVLCVLIMSSAGAVSTKPVEAPLPARLDEIIPHLMKAGEVPGLSIAVIRKSKIVFLRSYGVKNFQTGEPLKEDAIFEAASLSKPVFAYGVLKLAETGSLDLDASLAKHFHDPYIADDKRLNRITARMVLSHTTGFPNWRPNGGPLQIHFDPGSRFSYSGEGFVYLQKAVERLTNKPLNRFMGEHVFEPLQMTNSSFVWRKTFDNQKTHGHNSAGEAQPIRKPDEANAASSLNTTIGDYARFVVAILNGLQKDAMEQMMQPQVIVDDRCKTCIDVPLPEQYSKTISWGLGWGLQKTNDGLTLWHWGENNGEFHTYVSANPSLQSGIIIFANSGNGHSIIPKITSVALGEIQPAFAWMNYEPYDSPLKTLLRDIDVRGNRAIDDYKKGKSRFPKFDEQQINRLGYWLLAKKKMKESVELFKINTEVFPLSWNAHDSLAEAYMLNGERDRAIQSYKKSLELNPNNTNATEMLKKLGF